METLHGVFLQIYLTTFNPYLKQPFYKILFLVLYKICKTTTSNIIFYHYIPYLI